MYQVQLLFKKKRLYKRLKYEKNIIDDGNRKYQRFSLFLILIIIIKRQKRGEQKIIIFYLLPPLPR